MTNDPAPITPAPLTEQETRRLWRWERDMVRVAAMAIMVVAVVLGAAHFYGENPMIRVLGLGLGIVLLLAVIVMQLRERCPRCGTRLASNFSLALPEKCGRCGVAFPRPLNSEAELDN